MFFIEHIGTATSEAVTENSPGNWARAEKLHIISIFSTRLTKLKFLVRAENLHKISPSDIWLGSKYVFAQRLSILKNRKKNIENKAIQISISQLQMTGLQSLTKGIGKFLLISEPFFELNYFLKAPFR